MKKERDLLNEVGHMVETILHDNWLLRFNSLSFSLSLSLLEKTLLLGCLVLRPVLEQNLEQRSRCEIIQTSG